MIDRVTLTGLPTEGHDDLTAGAPIGVRGYPGTIVTSTPNAEDPDRVDLVVDVDMPDPEPAATDEPAPIASTP